MPDRSKASIEARSRAPPRLFAVLPLARAVAIDMQLGRCRLRIRAQRVDGSLQVISPRVSEDDHRGGRVKARATARFRPA